MSKSIVSEDVPVRRKQVRVRDCLLIETLAETPTVIAEGNQLRASRPLGNVVRGKMLPRVIEAVAEVRAGRRPIRLALTSTNHTIDAVVATPVLGPDGDVLGVQIVEEVTGQPTPPLQRVAGWEFIIPKTGTSLRTRWTPQFRDLYGIEADIQIGPAAEGVTEEVGLADLYRRVPRPSDIAVLINGLVGAQPGDCLDGHLIARRDDGALRLIRFVRRVVSTPRGISLRGIDHDITASTTTEDLIVSTLDAEIAATIARVAGINCALVDPDTGFVIKWITESPTHIDSRTRSGRAQILDDASLTTLRSNSPVVSALVSDPEHMYLVQSFPCIGHGENAASLMMFTAVSSGAD